ncbi:MAG: zinc ribbon-containing protein [Clostridiales bacterium]|nr:zinc ribbon-containing protein [Clostridiales bacterium]
MYKTGQKPGKGKYRCKECSQCIVLNDVKTTLPTCPKCKAINFYKVG